jgi:hypothetical protein
MPERIQLKRTRGWRLPEGAVSVARPTRWGNPWRVGDKSTGLCRVPAAAAGHDGWEYEGRISAPGMRHDYFHGDGLLTFCDIRFMTRAEVVECYRRALLGDDEPGRRFADSLNACRVKFTAEDVRRELAGKDLACWCPLDGDPCHADVLLKIAAEGWES